MDIRAKLIIFVCLLGGFLIISDLLNSLSSVENYNAGSWTKQGKAQMKSQIVEGFNNSTSRLPAIYSSNIMANSTTSNHQEPILLTPQRNGSASVNNNNQSERSFASPKLTAAYWNEGFFGGEMYVCGFNYGRLRENLFPEFDRVERIDFETKSDNNSLLLFGAWGPCPGVVGKSRLGHQWVAMHWRGKALFVNGERTLEQIPLNGSVYGIGATIDAENSVYSTFLGISFAAHYNESMWERIFNHTLKPKSLGTLFCVYPASNCVEFREKAADSLSEIGDVYQGGKCKGFNQTRLQFVTRRDRRARGPAHASWSENHEMFQKFRFCLVLENANSRAYITEKILNAFLGGCIPIYYGTEEVFNIFNSKAFVYYNISDPEPALERIRFLENNTAAYEAVQNEPILADGENTVDDYFSYSDKIGNGKLKRKIREMLGMKP